MFSLRKCKITAGHLYHDSVMDGTGKTHRIVEDHLDAHKGPVAGAGDRSFRQGLVVLVKSDRIVMERDICISHAVIDRLLQGDSAPNDLGFS